MKRFRWILVGCLALAWSRRLAAADAAWPRSPDGITTTAASADDSEGADAGADKNDPCRFTQLYRPAPSTVPLELRQESWKRLSLSQDKRRSSRFCLGRQRLSLRELACYLNGTGATDAAASMQQGLRSRQKSLRWLALCPALFTAFGGVVGGIAGIAQPGNSNATNGGSTGYAIIGGGCLGLAAGLLVGVPFYFEDRHEAKACESQAVDYYNHRLLQDLQLGAAPMPGGAALGVSGRF